MGRNLERDILLYGVVGRCFHGVRLYVGDEGCAFGADGVDDFGLEDHGY